ncbi:pentatricopeptide repeat-containing protein 1, mitochondrial-like isoform X2 [Homarus americanus]|nr:pentatricopeptide repeat-containing protein 1, mitochondrial-like isoform X2 [Homarus americanus]XP_042218601.1 pentatricopeptide repeat-containing protein 1, mitochondrial-like isoform X2 [Homarus americanus]XP_042218602.1 pentatricopeptide repeat-containing protein 1, mitochondrial-like isoform X2 [Homarus americanus]
MYSLNLRVGKCHPLWQSAVCSPHWLRLISSTPVKADSKNKDDSDTFGSLASLSSCSEKKLSVKDTDKNYVKSLPKIQYNKKFFEIQEKNRDTQKVDSLKNYHLENTHEKWNAFKDAHYEEILKQSTDILQDDSEDDYYYFLKRLTSKKAAKNVIEKNWTPEEERQKQNTPLVAENEAIGGLKSSNVDEFGTVSPPKIDYEKEVGDEGDEREEKYQESKLKRSHRPQYYGQQMKNLCKERKLSEALKIFEEMPSVGAKPNDFCYQVLINACGRAGYTKKAFQLYNQMKKRGLKVQPVAYTGLFNACANSPWPLTDGLKRATGLREQLLEQGYIFNQTISHSMIKAFGRCGNINTAFQIVDDMIEQGLLVTTETINFLLQACITNKEIGFRHAIRVWRKLRELKLSPDIYSYNLLIRAISACSAGDPQLTSKLLEGNFCTSNKGTKEKRERKTITEKVIVVENKKEPLSSEPRNIPEEQNYGMIQVKREVQGDGVQNHVLPDLLGKRITSGTIIGLGPLDQPQDRLALLGGPSGILKQMSQDRVKPDLKTVTQLLGSLPSSIQAEEALLQSMKNIGLNPDTQFCNLLIRKRNFRQDMEGAKDVLQLMQEHHLLPDIATFGCLALGCRYLDNALDLLRDMDAANFRPNLEILTILVKNSLVRQEYFYTLEILKEMHQRNITPDELLLQYLEQGRTKARNTLLKMEGENADMKIKRRKLEGMKIFLLEYKKWLKTSQVKLSDHPWAQYRTELSDNVRTIGVSGT